MKRWIVVISVVAGIVGALVALPVPQVAAQGNAAEWTCVQVGPGPVQNVRSGPGLAYAVLTTQQPGQRFVADLSRGVHADGYTWVPVRLKAGMPGWTVMYGLEPCPAAPPTAAAPTMQLSGIRSVTMPPSLVTEIVAETQRGGIVPGRDAVDLRHEVQGINVEGHLIYEQFMHFLDMLDAATPVGTGPYTYHYAAPTLAQPSPREQTFVFGAKNSAYCVVGARAATLDINFEWGQYVTFAAGLMGHSVKASALAALDEDDALTYATGSHVHVYVDDFDGTIGTNEYCARRGNIAINTQRQYERCMGSIYPTGTYDAPYWDISGVLTIEQDEISAGWVDALIAAGTKKLLRIEITNGETGIDERSLTMDIPALIRVDNLFTDVDGLVMVDLAFQAIEEGDWTDAGAGEVDGYFSASLVNNTEEAL